MSEDINSQKKKKFPWVAFVIYLVVTIGLVVFEFLRIDQSLLVGEETEAVMGGAIYGLLFGIVFTLIALVIQYALVKFPTQWISKEKDVYTFDIWTAIFYSGAIGGVINLLVQELNVQGNIIVSILASVATTALFLFFYYSGEEKEAHVKKAMLIVQGIYLIIGIGITLAGNALLADFVV